MRQRGFTLVEVLIVAAIVVMMAALTLGLSNGARPFGMRSAEGQFETAVAYARSLAANSGNGSTLVFQTRKDPQGGQLPGFVARVYSGRPNSAGPIQPAPIPAFTSSADIREATLGAPPFSIFFDSAGHASGMTGAVTAASTISADPGCPGNATAMAFTWSDGRSSGMQSLVCKQAVGGPQAGPSRL